MAKNRRVTYRLYPTKEQESLLFFFLNMHRHLYNALLEQHISIYRQSGKSTSFAFQCREITELRHSDPEYASMNAQSLQVTAKRIKEAFNGFFRRIASDDTPGFPRFKSRNRFTSFGYKTHGDGWKLKNGKPKGKRRMRNGKLYLSGIGDIKIRGASKHEGIPKTCEIMYKGGIWQASIVIEHEDTSRIAGDAAAGFDWGTEAFLTIAKEDGAYDSVPNPRNGMKSKKRLAKAQKDLSQKEKGSKNREKARKEVQRVYRDVKNQRTDFLHQESNRLVTEYGLLATEELAIQSLVEKNARERKHGLNREILDTSPSSFLKMLSYKAEEAGSRYSEINTKKWKPSQTCSGCGRQEKKELDERRHDCPRCFLAISRDENAARVCLSVVLTGKAHGWEPAICGGALAPNQESPSKGQETAYAA